MQIGLPPRPWCELTEGRGRLISGTDDLAPAGTAELLREACAAAGLDTRSPELIRAGENTLYRLPGGIVARVTRCGGAQVAAKEVQVSRWLVEAGVPVVEALADPAQPVVIADRAVTFWRELPPHREGTPAEVADLLRQLHALPPPMGFALPELAPFVRLAERITAATTLDERDRAWLQDRLAQLEQRYQHLPPGLPRCAIHGDPWAGNVAVTVTGPVILDLERFAIGPSEWDLASVAVNYTTFGNVSADEWADFCRHYGSDVTRWFGFKILRDIRELRRVTFAFQMADQHPHVREHARYRLACLQGRHGGRPWRWHSVP